MKQGKWLRKPDNDLTVIFIHGFNSSEECWKNPNGTYWPDLLKEENDLASIGIYVFSYQTSLFSGNYSLGDVVDLLREYLYEDEVFTHSQAIFVCHSMGGIVARRFLVSRQLELLKKGLKEVGLFLVASPSLGSGYANMLSSVSTAVGNTQGNVLKFSQSNTWLNDLDRDFLNMKETGNLKIRGRELIEDKPIFLKWLIFFKKQIVEPFSGARYFGNPVKIPGSDHFSIARPEAATSIQHRSLCRFIKAMKDKNRELEADRESKDGKLQPNDGVDSKQVVPEVITRSSEKYYNEEEKMVIEAFNIPVLLKATNFLFDEASKILQECRERRKETSLVSSQEDKQNQEIINSKDEALKQKIEDSLWQSSKAEIEHLLKLLEIYKTNYYNAKEKYIKWDTLAPAIVIHELTTAEDGVAETTQKLQDALSKVYGKQIIASGID